MPGKPLIIASIFVLGLVSNTLSHAQEVYVKDSLRVGVRTEPGNKLSPVSVVTTGMKLTVLESSGNYIKIKSANNIVGWVKKTYISPEPPARIHLQQLQEKHQKLQSDLAKQTKVARAAELNARSLGEEISQLKRTNAELRIQLDDQHSENMVSGLSYVWKFGLFLLFCIIGFVGGLIWHRSYAMKRLGGLRV